MKAGKSWKQSRVDIHDATGKGVQQNRGDQAHETSKNHQVDVRFLQGIHQGLVVSFAGLVVAMIDAAAGEAGLASPFQSASLRVIADDQDDFSVNGMIKATVDDGLQVRPSA